MLGGYLMAVDNKKAALEAAMKNIKKEVRRRCSYAPWRKFFS